MSLPKSTHPTHPTAPSAHPTAPAIHPTAPSVHPTAPSVHPNRVVVSVQGIDRVGIVAEVTRVLAEGRANLTDISQSILHDDLFVMVAMADLSDDGAGFDDLNATLTGAGERLGVEIRLQREQIFRAMHRV